MSQQYNMFQAFGSPMLGSTIQSMPRRDGDGMDKETLLRESITSYGTPTTKLRHHNLTNSLGEATVDVDRVKRGKKIPKEPVKGAVKPVLPAGGGTGNKDAVSQRAVRHVKPDDYSLQKPYTSGLTPYGYNTESPPKKLTQATNKTNGNNLGNSKCPEEAIVIENIDYTNEKSPNKDQKLEDFKKQSPHTVVSDLENCMNFDSSKLLGHQSEISEDISHHSTGVNDRQVEGQLLLPNTQNVEKLNKDVEDLHQQLEVMSKVNADLKKMLVASMGDDLHHKVDSLVRTKAQLASEIGGYTDKIYADHETLDKLAIQADMWHSKFNASRMLVDHLTSDRDKYRQRYTESRRAMQQMLQEHQQIKDSLVETHRYLKLLQDSFDPASLRRPTTIIPNVLELARTCHLLADNVKFRLLPAMPVFPTALDSGIQDGGTPAEKLAHQVLNSDDQPDLTSEGPSAASYNSPVKVTYDRFNPHVRYDNITFNCCAKCKGDIQVI